MGANFVLLIVLYFHLGVRVFKNKQSEYCTHHIVRKFNTSPILLLSAMKNIHICSTLFIDDLISSTSCPKNEPSKFPIRSAHHTDEMYEMECVAVLRENKAGSDTRWWKKSLLEINYDANWPKESIKFPNPENVDEQIYWDRERWLPLPARSRLFSNVLVIDFNESKSGTSGPFKVIISLKHFLYVHSYFTW